MGTVVSMEEVLDRIRERGIDEGLTPRERRLLGMVCDMTGEHGAGERVGHIRENHPSMIAKAKRLREQRC